MAVVSWAKEAGDGHARAGTLQTPHGSVKTPAFMPVGTRAAVKAVDVDDLVAVGAEIVLANTYHLMLRPGSKVIADLGGLHGFMAWEGPVLTDSGGFQIFSLRPKIDESGASFRSTYDGSIVHLTPEQAVAVQQQLGADIAMVLDVCVGLPAGRDRVEHEMRRTLRWAERSLEAHNRSDQALFGIVQGGVDPDLRAESAARTAAIGFPGFGIGGLSVGEPAEQRDTALEAAVAELPDDRPRYVMGLGDSDGLLAAIEKGADMFDCVIPTRLARHGKVLTRSGDYNIARAEFERDERPLEDGCVCPTCQRHSRAYVRHLVRMKELSSHRLMAIHNLHYTLNLVSEARGAIVDGRFAGFAKSVRAATGE
ncbi:MAG: tRNA guanosine(34) transglycosylase Tgt [Acidimicrobiia bacterium]|nr:tRNA guanosine(34) transglycosylase Tgt [Acidimicrobiia bacterium]